MIEFLTKVSRGSRNFAGELQNHTEHLHGRKFDSGILCKDGDDGGKIKREDENHGNQLQQYPWR